MKKKTATKSRTMTFQFTMGRINADLYHGYAALAMHALLLRGANFYGVGDYQAAWPKVAAERAHTFAQAMVEREPAVSAKMTDPRSMTGWSLAVKKDRKK